MKRIHTFIAGIALFAAGTAAWGQQVMEKKVLTLEGAKRVMAAAVAEAKKSSTPTGVIAIVDDGGNTVALERLDNTFAAGAAISQGKARTAALFKKPTKAFEEIVNKGRTAMVALNDFTPLQGGEPIVVDGQIVGAIGVSGAASAARDEEIAAAGAAALTNLIAEATSPAPVNYYDQGQVASSFSKGAVLYQNPGVNYQVHTSLRTQPGLAEVHARETDVIYVLDGEATFVTGGTVVEPKTTEPDQIRGKEITGGETRRISKGDVIIVPAGVPHQFKEVSGPLHYYVVKVS